MTDRTPTTAVAAVEPPPVRRGRRGKVTDPEVISALAEVIADGKWASDGILYDDAATANKAIALYKRDLTDAGVTDTLSGRTWEDPENKGKIRIAIARKV